MCPGEDSASREAHLRHHGREKENKKAKRAARESRDLYLQLLSPGDVPTLPLCPMLTEMELAAKVTPSIQCLLGKEDLWGMPSPSVCPPGKDGEK